MAVVLSPEGLVGDIQRSVPGVGAVELADVGGDLLYESPSPMGAPVEERINLPGEDWTLRVGLRGGGRIRHVAPLVALVGGLLLAILVGLLGRHLANRRSYAEALVRERTAELEEVAAKLGDAKASYERLTANIAEVLFTVELGAATTARARSSTAAAWSDCWVAGCPKAPTRPSSGAAACTRTTASSCRRRSHGRAPRAAPRPRCAWPASTA